MLNLQARLWRIVGYSDPTLEVSQTDRPAIAGPVYLLDAIDGTLRSIPPKRRGDHVMVQDAVQRAVRSAINEAWGKKPVVRVLLSVVDGRN